MTNFFSGLGTIVALELRQRVRGIAWYVLLAVFFVLVGVVTFAVWVITGTFGDELGVGSPMYSTVIYFVLLLCTLVAPALSGNSINGDRDSGTLATTQVTLVSTAQIVVGKFLAAWITALAFLLVAVPFLLVTLVQGNVAPRTLVISLLVLALEVGVVAAIGVGLSGLLAKPILSIVVTYLVVASLSIGTLIAFSLLGLANTSEQTNTYISLNWEGDLDPTSGLPEDLSCLPPVTSTYDVPRFDYFWGVLAANPYVILADAAAPSYSGDEYPNDLFGSIQLGVRSAQIAPELETTYNECEQSKGYYDEYDPGAVIDKTSPIWLAGLAIHLVLAVGALFGAWFRLRTPVRAVSTGTRIA